MDNRKYYNDVLAYDFEMFMPKEKKKTDNVIKLEEVQKPKKKTQSAINVNIKVISGFIVVLVYCFLLICMKIKTNEISSEINDIKTEINTLEAERTTLTVEIERILSYSNLELEAAELGMGPVSKQQVKYIRVNDKNTAITKNGKEIISEVE